MVKIKWTELASGDLNAIHKYVSRGSKIRATRLIRSIIDATLKLETIPLCGRIMPEFETYELREILHNDYRIIYIVKPDRGIDVLAVMHSSREIRQVISDML